MDSGETMLYREFITVDVERPKVMANGNSSDKHMTYPVSVKTNSLSFAAPHTRVYRRYSDFLWLHQRLKKIPTGNLFSVVPSLPRKQLPFWNFEEAFLQKRRKSLQDFLASVVRETVFLSSSSLHLFLQTELSPAEMDDVIEKGGVENTINQNLKCVQLDKEFMDTLGTTTTENHSASDSETKESDGRDSPDSDGRDSPVYWRCNESTMRKVASLPTFLPLMKQYESLFTVNSATPRDVNQ